MAFVRKKRVGGHEYYQLVESRWVEGKPRQRVLVHLGRYPTVETALKKWPKAIERLARFAQNKREEGERLYQDPTSLARRRATLETAEKAERRASALEANLKKLHDLRDRGSV